MEKEWIADLPQSTLSPSPFTVMSCHVGLTKKYLSLRACPAMTDNATF
jgi:hypothetical protein